MYMVEHMNWIQSPLIASLRGSKLDATVRDTWACSTNISMPARHAACDMPCGLFRPRVPGRGRCLEVRLSRPLDDGGILRRQRIGFESRRVRNGQRAVVCSII